jgi:hypothetical protein
LTFASQYVTPDDPVSILTDKHVVTALIVAPILAVLTFYLVDTAVKDKPQAALAGESYPLVPQSNCRFTSGQCDLENMQVSARLRVENRDQQSWLIVDSEIELDNIQVAFKRLSETELPAESVLGSAESIIPQAMQKDPQTGRWEIRAPSQTDENTQLMIVLQAHGVNYFADTTMAFSEYQTSFDKDF